MKPVLEIACNLVHEHKVITGCTPHELGVHHSDMLPKRGAAIEERLQLLEKFKEEFIQAASNRPEWMTLKEFTERYTGIYASYINQVIFS